MAIPLEQYYYGIDIVIVQTFQGEVSNDTLRLWGDNGALCRLYAGWPAGDTLILGINRTDLAGNTIQNPEYPPNLEQEGDYMISGCGVYLLDYQQGNVRGAIDEPTMQTMSLEAFVQQIHECSIITRVAESPTVDPLLVRTLGNSPCLEWNGSGSTMDLVVNDAQGRTVVRRRWDGSAFTLGGLAPGAYVVEVMRGGDRFVRKVAVL